MWTMNNRVACVRKTLHLTRSTAPVIPTCYLWSRLVKVRYTAAEWAATPPVLPKGLVSSLRGANNGDTILSHPGGGVPPLWILLLFLGPRSRPRLAQRLDHCVGVGGVGLTTERDLTQRPSAARCALRARARIPAAGKLRSALLALATPRCGRTRTRFAACFAARGPC